MDLDAALVAHAEWKFRLANYVEGRSTERLDPDHVGCDDRCDLGKWIHGQTHRSSILVELEEVHAAFHRAAAEVVSLVHSGRKEEARAALGFSGSYRASSGCVTMLVKAVKAGIAR